jgi:hypothetical protein
VVTGAMSLGMMFERSFPGLSNLQSVTFFRNLVLNCLFLLVGAHPPKGYNPPLREEDFNCDTCFFPCCLFIGLISSVRHVCDFMFWNLST